MDSGLGEGSLDEHFRFEVIGLRTPIRAVEDQGSEPCWALDRLQVEEASNPPALKKNLQGQKSRKLYGHVGPRVLEAPNPNT